MGKRGREVVWARRSTGLEKSLAMLLLSVVVVEWYASPVLAAEAAAEASAARRADADAREAAEVRAAAAPAEDVSFDVTPQAAGLLATAAPGEPTRTIVPLTSISLPQGSGTLRGMAGRSSNDGAGGAFTTGFPFETLPARGNVGINLGLGYSSAGGAGTAGHGWSLTTSGISRYVREGAPTFSDPPAGQAWAPGTDSFAFDGAELVPICVVKGGSCTGALPGEGMPAWAEGHRYFRLHVEGAFIRFFFSPDQKTWRVQAQSGTQMEFGVPLDASNDQSALERDPERPERIYRWNLARAYDQNGDGDVVGSARPKPFNVVAYRYVTSGGLAYLSDVYDTPPAVGAADAALSTYEHHVHLTWENRPDIALSYRRGYATTASLRLRSVEVTSKTYTGGSRGARRLVRRYHLTYDPAYRTSLLTSIQLEGRCSGIEEQNPAEDAQGLLPPTSCPRMPPVHYGYSHSLGADGKVLPPNAEGLEGLNLTLAETSGAAIPSTVTDYVDVLDVNGDGLADVIDTNPQTNQEAHAVYFNGAGGVAGAFASKVLMPFTAPPGTRRLTGVTMNFTNGDMLPFDIDADGRIDLVHAPYRQYPMTYQAQQVGGAWTWVGRAPRPESQVLSNLNDGFAVRYADVNGDGIVDVLTSGTLANQVYFGLGKYPGGDGQLGTARWTGAETATLSAQPLVVCAPADGGSVYVTDPGVRLVDMNGDGLVDLTLAKAGGGFTYWPGRGDGTFGTRYPADCQPGKKLLTNAGVTMANIPVWAGDTTTIADVNGDGLPDLLDFFERGTHIAFNLGGQAFSNTVLTRLLPKDELWDRMRAFDVNGSGTADLVYTGPRAYQYIDLLGAARPGLLQRVDDVGGATTEIEYTTTVKEMAAAERAGRPWSTRSPVLTYMVKRVTVRDNLEKVGRPAGVYTVESTYRDPVYDARTASLFGFREVTRTPVTTEPAPAQRVQYLLGECADDGVPGRCSLESRWRENLREALRGLPRFGETVDASGSVLSQAHTTYRMRVLYRGANGRAVVRVFPVRRDEYQYDTNLPPGSEQALSLVDVETELAPGSVVRDPAASVPLRAQSARVHTARTGNEDLFGHATSSKNLGCIEGCPKADESIETVAVYARPAGDTSGWLWRTTETWTTGSSRPGEKRHHLWSDFDKLGRSTGGRAELVGTLPLDRRHEVAGAAVAPTPPEASEDGILSLGAATYDAFGQVTTSRGPAGRCTMTSFDGEYQRLPVLSMVHVGQPGANGCGSRPIVTTASYDRGLGVALNVIGHHSETGRVEIDGFGRVTKIYPPHPEKLGEVSPVPRTQATYFVPENPSATPFTRVRLLVQEGKSFDDPSYAESWGYTDSLGRPLVGLSPADPSAGDEGQWIATGLVQRDGLGREKRSHLPFFWSGDPAAFPLSLVAASAFTELQYDAFGRVTQERRLDGSLGTKNVYHPLSVEVWDAEDLGTGTHAGTPSSVHYDGLGRVVEQVSRRREQGSMIEQVQSYGYLPTGEVTRFTRSVRNGTQPAISRWMQYDSLGRRVLNVEANTSIGFTAEPPANVSALKAWRYAYNDAGDLVADSDARGCGLNYGYDAAGRPLGTDYSPCLESHDDYTPANFATGDGTEVFMRYDEPDPDVTAVTEQRDEDGKILREGCPAPLANVEGTLVSVSSRGAKDLTLWDGQGRTVCSARRLAPPGSPAPALADRYAGRWYTKRYTLDAPGRPLKSTTGAAVRELLGKDGKSEVSISYTKRGLVDGVESSYGTLFRGSVVDAVGLTQKATLGDLAQTTTTFAYDALLRTTGVSTTRPAPGLWTSETGGYKPNRSLATPTTQEVLEATTFSYDLVGNPLSITDGRPADAWPEGFKPVSRTYAYDDFYRVTSVDYRYPSGSDKWTSPFAYELAEQRAGRPPKNDPSPHVAYDTRVKRQTYRFDALGNLTQATDDGSGFYDRSLGTQTHGEPTRGPEQLVSATGDAGPRSGSLTMRYDASGNLVSLAVQRAGSCLPEGSSCWARYAYEWDEAGILARARRWDLAGSERAAHGTATAPLPTRAADAALDYAYGASPADRVRKTALVDGQAWHTVYVFSSLELRHARYLTTEGDYEATKSTEVVRMPAGLATARLVYAETDLPTATSGKLHVFFELPDHLGSGSIVIDQETSELVEKTTSMAYGQTESDYRPDRWAAFREEYKFTGKEEDIEVGLQYFGFRYLSPYLMRWVSPDPLTIHGLGADPNPYAYVSGRVASSVDPLGLDSLQDDPRGEYRNGMPGGYLGSSAGGASSTADTRSGGGFPLDAGWTLAILIAGSLAAGAIVAGHELGRNQGGQEAPHSGSASVPKDANASGGSGSNGNSGGGAPAIPLGLRLLPKLPGPGGSAPGFSPIGNPSLWYNNALTEARWNPSGSSGTQTMLLGAGRATTFAETNPDAYDSISSALATAAPAIEIGVSMIPIVGTAIDAVVLVHPDSTWGERAGAALGMVIPGGGKLLEAGAVRLGERAIASEAKAAAKVVEKVAEGNGILRSAGKGTWISRGGLRYGADPSFENRVRHVLNHASDIPGRAGAHGVFDAGSRGALDVVDEAWAIAQRGGSAVAVSTQGARTVYTVDMGRRVGFVGGRGGAAAGNPAASHVRLVLEGTDVITAFPVVP